MSLFGLFSRKIFLVIFGFAFSGITFGFFLSNAESAAGVPKILSYQGRLADSGGNLLGGSGTSYDFRFSLYTASSGGTKLWPAGDPCTHSLAVRDGVFNANIGDTNSCSDILDFDFTSRDEVYLQVEIYNSSTLLWEAFSPRQRVNSSAFALVADTLISTSTQSRLGTTSPIGTSLLTIEATSSSVIPLTIRGASGQNSDILRIQVASGADMFTVIASGSASTTDLFVSSGFFQSGFGDCSAESQAVLYNAITGKFDCGNDATGGASATLQGSYDNSTAPATIATVSAKDIYFNLEDTVTDSNFFVNIKGSSDAVFGVQQSSSTVFFINRLGEVGIGTSTSIGDKLTVYAGTTTLQTTVNVPGAFRILNAATSSIFQVDTLNSRIGVATSAPVQTLSVSGSGYITTGFGVGRATTTSGNFEVQNDVQIGGALSVGGTVSLTCSNCISDANVVGALTISGGTIDNTAIGVSVPLTAVFTLSTSTYATTSYLAVTSFASTSALRVSNASNLQGDTTIGQSQTQTLTVNATSSFANNAGILGSFFIGDDSSDILTVSATSTFQSNVGFNGDISIGNAQQDNITINSGIINYGNTATNTVLNDLKNVWSISTSTSITPILSISTFTGTGEASLTAAGRVGIGTSSPQARLSIDSRTASNIGIAGIHEILQFTPTAGGYQFGDRMIVLNSPEHNISTSVAKFIRVIDNSGLANYVSGVEVQTSSGTTTAGNNIAIRGTGKTFGIQGVTTGTAAGVFIPAGIYAETQSTSSDAMRIYSSTTTIGNLISVYQEGIQDFSGRALKMDLGNGGSTFSGYFFDLQVAGTSRLVASSSGSIGIGTSTVFNYGGGVPSTHRGIHIESGAMATGSTSPLLLLETTDVAAENKHFITARTDSDGTPLIQFIVNTDGTVQARGSITASSIDVAEWFPAKSAVDTLKSGDLVSVDGANIQDLVKRSDGVPYDPKVIGIISTKPGVVLGGGAIEDTHENEVLVALVGRVPVKVSTEGGLIKPGDRITSSSLSGVGMKATTSGYTIGIALEAFDGTNYLSEGSIGMEMTEVTQETVSTTTKVVKLESGKKQSGGGGFEGEDSASKGSTEILVEETLTTSTTTKVAPKNSSAEEKITPEGTTVKIGKILVFVNLGYSKLDDSAVKLAQGGGEMFGPNNAWSVDQSTGKVNVGFYGDIDMHGNNILNVASMVSENGKWRIGADGVLEVQEIKAKKATIEESLDVGTSNRPTGITIYDEATGEPYCIKIVNGAMVSGSGRCKTSGVPASGNPSDVSSPSLDESALSEPQPSEETPLQEPSAPELIPQEPQVSEPSLREPTVSEPPTSTENISIEPAPESPPQEHIVPELFPSETPQPTGSASTTGV